jgi:hypothetical protein
VYFRVKNRKQIPGIKEMMFALFSRGASMSEIENQSYIGLRFWYECHYLMAKEEKKAQAQVRGKK